MYYKLLAVIACLGVIGSFGSRVFAEDSSESADTDSSASSVVIDSLGDSSSEENSLSSTAVDSSLYSVSTSETAVSSDVTYTVDEIQEIIKQYPNAFQTAIDPNATVEESENNEPVAATENTDNIWDKPFDDYSPTEGYLLLLFMVVLSAVAFKICTSVLL